MRVLLTPVNGSSERVLECLRVWSQAGLLEPFAWRSAEKDEALGETTRVLRVDAGETRDLLLGAALQDFDESDDELIAFYPATPAEAFAAEFSQAAAVFVHLLAQTIAHDASRPARCTMVVAPSRIGQHVPSGLVRQNFASNVYIAPEDRAEPRDPNRLLGNEEVFPMHAAHAIATVADLWNGPRASERSVVDLLAERQPRDHLAVQVLRCFSRGVDFGYLPDHVSAGIFHASGGWPNPDGSRFERIEDAGSVVPHLVTDFMSRYESELGLSHFEPQRLPDPDDLGLFQAFRLLVKVLIQRIRRKPFEIVRERIDSIHNAAADWVEKQAGPDSGIRVKRRGRRGDGAGVADLTATLERPLVVPDGPVADAWVALRRLVLGLVDGNELPEGIDQTRLLNGKRQRALVTDPAALVPNPESEAPTVAELAEGPICDPMRLDPALVEHDSESVRNALAEWAAEHRSALLWRVGLKIGGALATARREAHPADDPEATETDETEGSNEEAQAPAASVEAERKGLRLRLRKRLIM